jgi:hypothetical protein
MLITLLLLFAILVLLIICGALYGILLANRKYRKGLEKLIDDHINKEKEIINHFTN